MDKTISATTRPRWLFDEFQDFGWSDTDEIEIYDKKANVDPALERERLLALGVSKEHTLIDFVCGTGASALEAAKFCKRVIAVDVSAAMLTYMKRKAESFGLVNIDYVQQGFLTYLALPIYAAPVCRRYHPLKHVVDCVFLTKRGANQMIPATISIRVSLWTLC